MIILYARKDTVLYAVKYVIILWGYVCVYTHPKSVKPRPSLPFQI